MSITGNTKVVGLFGYPVTHSLSPVIHNLAFKEVGIDFAYLPFPVSPSCLKEAVRALPALGIRGVNVTIPHKEKIMGHLDEIRPEAKKIGAVNTVVNDRGKLTGYNTDGEGFFLSLKEKNFSLEGKKAILLGAGGAALSVAFCLLKKKIARLILINRTVERAKNVQKKLNESFPGAKIEVVEFERRNRLPFREVDLLVNATSVGMHEEDICPIDIEQFPSCLYVYDIVYNRKTQLLSQAEKRGMRHQGGLDMLVFQAALAFKMWTGKGAPVDKMRKVATDYLDGVRS